MSVHTQTLTFQPNKFKMGPHTNISFRQQRLHYVEVFHFLNDSELTFPTIISISKNWMGMGEEGEQLNSKSHLLICSIPKFLLYLTGLLFSDLVFLLGFNWLLEFLFPVLLRITWFPWRHGLYTKHWVAFVLLIFVGSPSTLGWNSLHIWQVSTTNGRLLSRSEQLVPMDRLDGVSWSDKFVSELVMDLSRSFREEKFAVSEVSVDEDNVHELFWVVEAG